MAKCVMCGAKMIACEECGELFHPGKKGNVFCRGRCRTRKSRRLASGSANGGVLAVGVERGAVHELEAVHDAHQVL